MDEFTRAAIQRGKENPSWVPLESNPDALTGFARGIGMPDTVAFVDCFGLDAELLGFLPAPVYGFVLLFPCDNEKIAAGRREAKHAADAEAVECFWMEQSIGNACGTIAVVHALLNNRDRIALKPDSLLARYGQIGQGLSPADRGYLLGGWNEIKEVHVEAAVHCESNQTSAPAAEDNVNNHFVAFACVGDRVVEFDGCKQSHIVHGKTTQATFAVDCAKTIQEKYFELDPNANFSIIVLAAAPNE